MTPAPSILLPRLRSLTAAAITVLSLLFLQPEPASAQGPKPDTLDVQDTKQGIRLLSEGKYGEAAQFFLGIPKNYPTSPMIPEANFRLAYCYYFMGEFDKGVELLKATVELKNVPKETVEAALGFIPKLLLGKAMALPENAPNRKEALQTAVNEFDAFLKRFPNSEEVEAANLVKAQAHFALEQFDEAVASLRFNIQKFPQSPSALDNKYSLAFALGTKSKIGLSKATAPDPEAIKTFDEANKLFGELIFQRVDLALSNDAQFQIAEMQQIRGQLTEGDDKARRLRLSLDAYRAVLPKSEVVKLQQAKVAFYKGIVERGGMPADQFRLYQRTLMNEKEKLANFEARADQFIPAKLKMANVYVTLEQYDAARIVARFLENQMEDPEQKKQVAYILALTYAVQHLTEPAVKYYDAFMAAYKADPMAENLPILLGAAFSHHNKPDEAAKYFKAQTELYPQSKLTSDAAMNEALSLIPLGKFDDALEVLIKFLKTNPEPPQARAALMGLGSIYQKTGKNEESLKSFLTVRDDHKGTPEADQASYWVAQLTFAKGDTKAALDAAQLFLTEYPSSQTRPAGFFLLGQIQTASNDKAGALASYTEITEKHPKSDPAPNAYFSRAALHLKDQEYDQVKAVMAAFLDTYPDSDRSYSAYDFIAQVQIAQQANADAIATYEKYLALGRKEVDVAKALVKVSNLYKKLADAMPVYLSLNEQQRKDWEKAINSTVSSAEKVVEQFPDASEVSLALQNLLACQKLMQRVKLKSEKDVDDYFQSFAKKFESQAATKSKILFAYAGLLAEKQEEKSFETMKAAYDEKLVYAPADLDLYGGVLLKKKDWTAAQKIFEKLAKDYPIPANTTPDKAPRIVGEAQSTALYGFAKVLQGQDKKAEAMEKFAELKTTYPFSTKLLEADFGIAEGEFQAKKLEEALTLLGKVAKSTVAPTNLRARAMLLIGKISQEKGDVDSAINNYIKVGALFPAESELAPDGLWRGAQLIEEKMAKAAAIGASKSK